MEAGTAPPRRQSTGSATIADIDGAGRRALRRRAGGPRSSATASGATSPTRELGEIVSEIARGLIDLGIEPGDRVALLCTTRARVDATPTSRITSAGGVVVPIYPTNSPEECAWVAGNSESRFDRLRGRRAGGEDRRGPRASCPRSRRSSSIDAAATSATRSRSTTLRERGRGARRRPRSPSAPRPSRPRTRTRSSTPRARPGRPRAACSRTATTARSLDMCEEIGVDRGGRRRLPLPAARALLRAADPAAGDRPRRARSPTGAATRSRSSPS